jgi:predicted NBD/HSP70 family sugar kinase
MDMQTPLNSELNRNDRRILGLVFRGRAVTQSALIEETQLTQQSVSRIVSQLMDAGLMMPGERVGNGGRRGYPSTSLRLNGDYAFVVGAAIMADAIAVSLTDFAGKVCTQKRVPVSSPTRLSGLDCVDQVVNELCQLSGVSRGAVAGMGIAVAGSFIEAGGFNTPAYLEDWAGADVAALFAERFGLPCLADNDGNTAAVAESLHGVGRWAGSFGYLYVSSGVGGGVILNGELWRGRFGNAGEFAGGLPPDIFPFPNLELLRQSLARDGILFETVDDLVDNYDPDWPAIEEWIVKVRDSLSIICSNATAILDIDAFVLGGRMPTGLAERVIPHINIFDQKRRGVTRPAARIVPAEAKGEVAAIGASLLPLKKLFFDTYS